MKCSKLIDILQQLEYELDNPNVVIRLSDEYDPEVAIQVEDYGMGKTIVIM